MTSLVERRPLELLRSMEDSGALTPTALTLTDPDLDFDTYEAVGRWLGALRDATAWWIGDWLIFGEGVYGEKYAQAVEATGRSKQTLKNYLWVAMAIPASRRRDDLSWSHHAEVAKLEPREQRRWLDRAERERWSVEELRGAMRDVPPIEVLPAPGHVIEVGRLAAEQIAGALEEAGIDLPYVEEIRAAATANGGVKLRVKDGRPCETCGGTGVRVREEDA